MLTDDEKAMLEKIKNLSIEEKIELLSEEEKHYLAGFMDGALWRGKKERESKNQNF